MTQFAVKRQSLFLFGTHIYLCVRVNLCVTTLVIFFYLR